MKIACDLNVLLDVAQNRPQFYQDSEEVLARARLGEYEAVIEAGARSCSARCRRTARSNLIVPPPDRIPVQVAAPAPARPQTWLSRLRT